MKTQTPDQRCEQAPAENTKEEKKTPKTTVRHSVKYNEHQNVLHAF